MADKYRVRENFTKRCHSAKDRCFQCEWLSIAPCQQNQPDVFMLVLHHAKIANEPRAVNLGWKDLNDI